MEKFKSILVANRGEIAVRIIRTAKALGYRTIALYSSADKDAQHTKEADESFLLGPSSLEDSYLEQERIINFAKLCSAEAIHPGYGFLSENPDFTSRCESEGLIFIGPKKDTIALMGNKAKAKRHMEKAGVPCIPGYQGEDQSDKRLVAEAKKIGFPLMVKAAAGGGGKGMRIVDSIEDFKSALKIVRSEALSIFGNNELIIEKALLNARHVEIQVFADTHGNVIHLGERDCSVQRRYQKIIEEAPCLSEPLRKSLGEAAVKAAKSIGYIGAGTFEFLLEGIDFYFMEMNTRLQVEHTVTEMITGLDLVELQIQVAQGRPLGLTQKDISFKGHAFEARLYAEDPSHDFLPSTGKVELWSPAKGVRIDTGLFTGEKVTPFYDPMVAKFISWGKNREEARNRLIKGLKESVLFGVKTNKSFLLKALEKESLVKGPVSTDFIEKEFTEEDLAPSNLQMMVAACLQYFCEREDSFNKSLLVSPSLKNWTSGPEIFKTYHYSEKLTVSARGRNYRVKSAKVEKAITFLSHEKNKVVLQVEETKYSVIYHTPEPGRLFVSMEGRDEYYENKLAFSGSQKIESGDGKVISPMHGVLFDVFVKPGEKVEKGKCVAIVEAMKMQNEIRSEVEGVVCKVYFEKGVQITAGQLIMEIEVKEK